jgi:hypothetical protein
VRVLQDVVDAATQRAEKLPNGQGVAAQSHPVRGRDLPGRPAKKTTETRAHRLAGVGQRPVQGEAQEHADTVSQGRRAAGGVAGRRQAEETVEDHRVPDAVGLHEPIDVEPRLEEGCQDLQAKGRLLHDDFDTLVGRKERFQVLAAHEETARSITGGADHEG